MALVSIAEGVWYDPDVIPVNYGEEYFNKYVGYSHTPLGAALTGFRVAFTRSHCNGYPVVDFGIGSGQFVEAMGADGFGYDINPVALRWLRAKRRLQNPYAQQVQVLTCWDSLEHVAAPGAILGQVSRFLLVSIPTFRSLSHVRESKHYRPDEHYWYFTRAGLVEFMDRHGFSMVGWSDGETRLGREDIETFAFKREG